MKEKTCDITGFLDGVGGDPDNDITAKLILKDDTEIECVITIEMAKHIGKKLFQTITLRGFYIAMGRKFMVVECIDVKS